MNWGLSHYSLSFAIFLVFEEGVQLKLNSFLQVFVNIPTHLVVGSRGGPQSGNKKRAIRGVIRGGPKSRSKSATALGRNFQGNTSKLIINKVNRRKVLVETISRTRTKSYLECQTALVT